MEIGAHQAAASMAAIERWHEAIADNIASSSSPGFKAKSTGFRMESGSAEIASTQSAQVANLPTAYSTTNFGQGELRTTGQSLDLAISGEGFFAIKLPTGQTAYTRDGEFKLSPDNRIVTKGGGELLGEGGVPIFLDPVAGPATILPDGQVVQGEMVAGKIPLYALPADELKSIGGSLFLTQEDFIPAEAGNATIQQGFLEASNVSVVGEMVSLITASRAYEAAQRVLTSHDETGARAVQTFSQA